MLIEEVNKENDNKIRQMEDEFNTKIHDLREDEANLKREMDVMQKYSAMLEREKLNEKNMRTKLEEELLQNSKNHEEEVQLRLKFESKLNNMHSIHRDLGTKYRRALLDIETLQNTNELLNSKKLEIIEQLNKMKAEYAEQNTKMAYDREKILALERENGIKIDQVNDLLNKTSEMQERYDKLQYQYQLALKQVSEQKLGIDVYTSQIQTLKNEKTHLRQSEVESRMLKEVFENKLRDTADELKKTTEQLQLSQREVLGFTEIKKEREERIDKLKADLDAMTVNFHRTDAQLTKTSIDLDKTSIQLASIQVEYTNTVEKLKRINKARNDKEARLSQEKHLKMQLKKEVKELKEQIKVKDHKLDEINDKITDKEKEISSIHIDLDSLDKKSALQINQLNEKIINISGLLLAEQESKNSWIDKFEKEQKLHMSSTSELLQVKSTNKDLELKAKDLEVRLEFIQKTSEKLQEKSNQIMGKYENVNRELKTKKEILKQVEKQKDVVLEKHKEEFSKLENDNNLKLIQQEMYYEDMLSRVRILQESYDVKEKEFEVLSVKEKVSQRKIERLETMKSEQEQLKEEIKSQLSGTSDKVKELEEQIKKLRESIDPLKQAKERSESQIVRLSVDLKKKVDEIKDLYKQIKILDKNLKRSKAITPTPIDGENYKNNENAEEYDLEKELEKEDIMEDVSQFNPVSVMGNQDIRNEDNISEFNKEEPEPINLPEFGKEVKHEKEESAKNIIPPKEVSLQEKQISKVDDVKNDKDNIQDDMNPLKIMKKNIIARNSINEKEVENTKDKNKQFEIKTPIVQEKELKKEGKELEKITLNQNKENVETLKEIRKIVETDTKSIQA